MIDAQMDIRQFQCVPEYQELQVRAESYLESRFWHDCCKRGRMDRFWCVIPQCTAGRFRLDAMFVKSDGYRICVELDGKAYHRDPLRDLRRDAVLLTSNACDEIIRIPFPAVEYFSDATFSALAVWHTEFSGDGNCGLFTLSEKQFFDELEAAEGDLGNGDYRNIDHFVDDIQSLYEIFAVTEAAFCTYEEEPQIAESYAFVGSPKSFYRGRRNPHRIKRLTRGRRAFRWPS